jgi:hypothetical protein
MTMPRKARSDDLTSAPYGQGVQLAQMEESIRSSQGAAQAPGGGSPPVAGGVPVPSGGQPPSGAAPDDLAQLLSGAAEGVPAGGLLDKYASGGPITSGMNHGPGPDSRGLGPDREFFYKTLAQATGDLYFMNLASKARNR